MMQIPFDKMHGLGNDFIMIDATQRDYPLERSLIQKMAQRCWGIGCDQVLLLATCDDDDADFVYRIFNADGSEAEQCGNGARCMYDFIQRHALSDKSSITLKTLKGNIVCRQAAHGLVSVDMGPPQAMQAIQTLQLVDREWQVSVIDVGNPHAVIFADQPLDNADWLQWGEALSVHPQFPGPVNASVAYRRSPTEIDLNVYERGAGPTLACGSGACAAVVAGCEQGLLKGVVTVRQRGGDLSIHYAKTGATIEMIGPVQFVYSGIYPL